MTATSNEEFAKRMTLLAKPAEQFRPTATYDPDGDCIEFLAKPDPFYAERLDDFVTVYYSQETGEIIGSLINLFDKARQTKTQEEGSAYLDKLAAVIAKFGRPAIPSLIKALQENNAMIRWGACKALGAMGPLAKEADRHLQLVAENDRNLFIIQEADKARRRIAAR